MTACTGEVRTTAPPVSRSMAAKVLIARQAGLSSTAIWPSHSANQQLAAAPDELGETCGVPHARFSDDALLQCYLAEKAVLRRITPDWAKSLLCSTSSRPWWWS